LVAIFQALVGGIFRAQGLFHNPNTLSMYALFGCAISLYLFDKSARTMRLKSLPILYLLISILALFSGGARASLAALIIFVPAYLILTRRFKMLFMLSLTVGLAAVVIISTHGLFAALANYARIQSGTTGRAFIWEAALKLLKDNPIFGVGPGAVGQILYGYVQATHPIISFHLRDVIEYGLLHNGYLQIGTAMGIPAMLIHLYINFGFPLYLRGIAKADSSPFIKNLILVTAAFILSRMTLSLFESVEQNGPIATDASVLVILTGVQKVIESQAKRQNMPNHPANSLE